MILFAGLLISAAATVGFIAWTITGSALSQIICHGGFAVGMGLLAVNSIQTGGPGWLAGLQLFTALINGVGFLEKWFEL
jgi:hypothetical protein